jgi:pyridoxamine 5'-phosphate oxidase
MITSGTIFGHDCDPADYPSIDPLQLLAMWIPPAGTVPPPLLALATVGSDGYPRVRHVLLSEFDGTAIHFHTDVGSGKVSELHANPRAAGTVVWPDVGRQLSLHGEVHRAARASERAAYTRRGRYQQLLAWLNTPEVAALPEAERHARWARFDAEHAHLDAPPTWVGFAVRPQELTFWRGDPDGPPQRVRYRRTTGAQWDVEVLPG